MTSPQWGPPQGQPTFPGRGFGSGAPAFGQNHFGQAQFGQAQFGQAQFGQGGGLGFPGGGFQPMGFPPPARRRNPLRGCLLGLLLVVGGFFALGAIGLGLLGKVVQTASDQPTSQTTTAPADPTGDDQGTGQGGDQGTSEPTMTLPSSSSTASTRPSASTTASASSSASTSSGGYQNDSYQVPSVDTNPPDLPEPDTYSQARTWLTSNALYQQSVAKPVRCEMTPMDLSTASRAQLQSHLNELTGCLMRVWGPTLKAAGYTAVRPSVTIYSGSVTTQCGKLPKENAVYCGADQQIYYAADLPDLIPSSLDGSKFITESVIAHEFGHAVQARSGILVSESALADQQSSKSAKYNYSRRLEQQADCFAGQFVSSIAQSTGMTSTDLDNIQKLFYSFGDDQLTGNPYIVGNHGHGNHRAGWMRAGMGNPQLGTCNTFTASNSSTS